MGGLIHGLLGVGTLGKADAGIGPAVDVGGGVGLVVDLVEGHPVLDLVFVALHDSLGIADEEADHPAVQPAAVLFGQVVGHFKMAEGDHRLDAILEQLVEQIVVELQAGLVGGFLVSLGKDAGPGNGGAEALEAHLGKQLDVVFVSVVKINGIVVGVAFAGQDAVGDAAGYAVRAGGQHVADAGAFAPLIPAAFQLVGSHRAAPQEILR